jgi:uncharacterized protein
MGNESANNGVLIVLVLKDRQVWIEVGYGLEGRLPDGKVGRILEEYTVPYLKNQQPNLAIDQTYKIITKKVLKEYGLEENQLTIGSQPSLPQQSEPVKGSGIPSWLFIIIVVVVLFLDFKFFGGFLTHMLLSIILKSGGRGGGAGGGGGSSGGGGAGRGW